MKIQVSLDGKCYHPAIFFRIPNSKMSMILCPDCGKWLSKSEYKKAEREKSLPALLVEMD
jgi:hypothetical protein